MIDFMDIDHVLCETIEGTFGWPVKNRDSAIKIIATSLEKNGLRIDDFNDICIEIVDEYAGDKYTPTANIIIDKINHRKVHKNESAWDALASCDKCVDGVGWNKDLEPVLCKCAKGTEHPQRKIIPFEVGESIALETPIEQMIGLVSGAARDRLDKRLGIYEENF